MKGIRPCPYCGGEVEVIRLPNHPKTKKRLYRIECRHCHALTAKGTGFPDETPEEAEARIRDYDAVMKKQLTAFSKREERTYRMGGE